MSATEELRRLLDERGVKWVSFRDRASVTAWMEPAGTVRADEYDGGLLLIERVMTPEQAIAATLGKPTWRNSYDQQRYDRWYNSLFHGEPSSFYELIESVIWTTETVDLGPNGNECQGVDEGEVYTKRLIESWAKLAATLGAGTCKVEDSIIDTYEYNRREYTLSCGHTIIWESDEPPNYCPNCGAKVVKA